MLQAFEAFGSVGSIRAFLVGLGIRCVETSLCGTATVLFPEGVSQGLEQCWSYSSWQENAERYCSDSRGTFHLPKPARKQTNISSSDRFPLKPGNMQDMFISANGRVPLPEMFHWATARIQPGGFHGVCIDLMGQETVAAFF